MCGEAFYTLLVLVVFASKCTGENADLRVSGLSINNPNPNQNTPVYLVDTATTVALMTFYVNNDGPDNLEAAASGNNYEVKVYIAELNSDETAIVASDEVSTFTLSDESGLSGALANGANVFYMATNFALTYPSNLCASYTHVCAKVEKDAGATYDDTDATNDFNCLPFIQGTTGSAAGLTDCPSDIVPIALNVTDPSPPSFVYGSEVNVTLSVTIENQGGTAVVGSTANEDNLAFSKIFIANTQSESASTMVDFSDTLQYTWNDVSDGIDEWGNTEYSGITASITIPEVDCADYVYLCIVLDLGINSTADDDTSNNLYCGEFGSFVIGGIGEVICPIITTTVSVTQAVTKVATTQGQISTTPVEDESTVDSSIVSVHIAVIVGIAIGGLVVGAAAALLIQYSVAKFAKAKELKKNANPGLRSPNARGPWFTEHA
ncbi:uncharacterized protein LOC100376629 [Saccoglossus kowalevskii]|uniref:Uncharacterized protein LOC100376629 n=1 Tax=Saccoglossus kowalevskii TaxID=10224 RepID=A0ABM0MFD1_SACKO|nr:PREDICTED: uncharacterized protein LOC100376629 [Saccoglossus kowalevskii]